MKSFLEQFMKFQMRYVHFAFVVHCTHHTSKVKALGVDSIAVQCDVRDEKQIENVIKQTLEKWGRQVKTGKHEHTLTSFIHVESMC
jgi:hypothetical protein